MRIAHIVGSFGDGMCGVGDFAYHLSVPLARRVSGRGGDSGVFVITAGSAEAAAGRHKIGFTNSPYEDFKDFGSGLYVRGGVDFSMLRASPAAAALREAAPDAVIVQYPSKGFGWTLGAPLSVPHIAERLSARLGRQIPLLAAIHEYKDAHPLRRRAVDALARSAHRVITPCVLEAAAIRGGIGVEPVVIPDGDVFSREIEPAEMELLSNVLGTAKPGRERAAAILELRGISGSFDSAGIGDLESKLAVAMEPGGERFRFFSYGHLAASKDPFLLLEALKLSSGDCPEIKLALASNLEGGGIRQAFRDKIARLGLERQVIPLGPLPAAALKAMAENCAAQIYTFKDGFTGKRSSTISALAFECPIVATRAEEVPTPFVEIPKGNVKELADQLLKITTMEKSEYEVWRTSQIHRQIEFRKEFDFAVIAERYLDAICSLLA